MMYTLSKELLRRKSAQQVIGVLMIEHEDTPTMPRPIPQKDASGATTIQVPAVQAAQAMQSAPTAHPYMSIDDLLALQVVSDPQISPDGMLIAFTVQRSNGETNTTSSAIWLVHSAGGKTATPWQVTRGEHHDFAPRWSPDGRILAFLSDRGGAPQIYLLPMSSGEARQLSKLSQGVTDYNWKPDGTALLAHSPWKAADDQ